MSSVSMLAQFALIAQLMAITLMVIMYQIDVTSFTNMKRRSAVIPGLIKVVNIFRNADKPIFQAFYFFILVLVIFSYAAFGLIVVLIVQRLFIS